MKNKRAINVKTRLDYIRLLLELHDNGYKWNSGGELLSGSIDMVNLAGEKCDVIYINKKERVVTWGSVGRHGSLFEDRWIDLETYDKDTFSLKESVDVFKVGDGVNINHTDWTDWFTPGEIYTIRGINRNGTVAFLEVPYKTHISKLTHAKRRLKPLTRAIVVERAKEYIERNASLYLRDVSFVVNEEKRTVVALEKGLKIGNGKLVECVLERGISKCQPDDVFNVHIGKAIALARVLGEDVPDYFLNSPLPEALLDGMKVRSHWSGCIFTVGDDNFLWKLDECDIVDDSDVMYYAGSAKSRFYY